MEATSKKYKKFGAEPVKPLILKPTIVDINAENLFSLVFHHQTYHKIIIKLFKNSKLRNSMGLGLVNGSLIDKNAELGKDVIVHKGAVILGKTKIQKGRIEKGAVIINSVIKNIKAEKNSMVVWMEQFDDKKIIAKQSNLIADIIILDEQIVKKIRVNIKDNKKKKSLWNLKLWQEINVVEYNKSKRYSLSELFKLSKFGISNFDNLSSDPMSRYYLHLNGSSKKFKEAVLNNSATKLFQHIETSKRLTKEPILEPSDKTWQGIYWEKLVYNATKIKLDGITYLIYRAMGEDHVSRLGLATSKDGIHIDKRLPYPIVYLSDYKIDADSVNRPRERRGIEDPHLTLLKNEHRIVLLYTIAFATKEQICQQACASISIKDFVALPNLSESDIAKKWRKYGLISNHEERNAILFPEKIGGKYAMIRRPIRGRVSNVKEYKQQKRHIGISFSDVLEGQWPAKINIIIKNREGMWDSDRVGPCALLKTNKGWLLFYHGVGKLRGRKSYMMGWALLDIKNPQKVLDRSDNPIFIPEKDYELYGWVPNVTIGYGATIKGKDSNEIVEDDDEIIISYGGADRVISQFSIKFPDILKVIKQQKTKN